MRVAALAAALAAASCSLPLPAPRGAPEAPAAPAGAEAAAAAILDEANRVRALHGVRAMAADAALHGAAQAFAGELAERRVLEHTSVRRGLTTPGERVTAAGVRWTAVAENLGMLSGPVTAVPRQVVQMWLDSPGHRSNLLQPDWTLSGVGLGVDQRGYYYVVQLYVVAQGGRGRS